jgi:mannose-6-phosphate isomerase-like protein (cupin superfamily)
MSRLNVYADEPWDRTGETMRIRTRFLGQPLGAKELGASVHELLPGSTGFHLHAHYGMEEMFFVLSGTPTLRTGDGDDALEPGDAVFCPRGLAGLHTFTNPTDRPATHPRGVDGAHPGGRLLPRAREGLGRDARSVRGAGRRRGSRHRRVVRLHARELNLTPRAQARIVRRPCCSGT